MAMEPWTRAERRVKGGVADTWEGMEGRGGRRTESQVRDGAVQRPRSGAQINSDNLTAFSTQYIIYLGTLVNVLRCSAEIDPIPRSTRNLLTSDASPRISTLTSLMSCSV